MKREGKPEQLLADMDVEEALDMLSAQGKWSKCLDIAKPHGQVVLHKYIALYATDLIRVKTIVCFYSGNPAVKYLLKSSQNQFINILLENVKRTVSICLHNSIYYIVKWKIENFYKYLRVIYVITDIKYFHEVRKHF